MFTYKNSQIRLRRNSQRTGEERRLSVGACSSCSDLLTRPPSGRTAEVGIVEPGVFEVGSLLDREEDDVGTATVTTFCTPPPSGRTVELVIFEVGCVLDLEEDDGGTAAVTTFCTRPPSGRTGESERVGVMIVDVGMVEIGETLDGDLVGRAHVTTD